MEFSKKDRDAFNKLFAEVSNSSSKNSSKKNKKGKRNAEKVSDCKKVKSLKGAVRDCKDFAQQQWEGLGECLEKLIKDETAKECDEVPLHFACLVGLVDLIKLFEGIETKFTQKGKMKKLGDQKMSDEIEKERNKMFGILGRRNLPKLEGKVWNMGEIRKRDRSLIKLDLDKACDEMMKKLNKWGSRKFT